MNVTKSLLSLALVIAPFTAGAYQKAENMEQAKSLVSEDGYAIVTYADGWDKYSRPTAEAMLADPVVSKALGNAVVLTLPVPDISTKEDHEANRARFGNLDLSYPNAYPAFILYDKNGRRMADLSIPFAERNNPTLLAEKISKALSGARKQAKLLQKAEKATGVEKARLLGEASNVPGIKRPDNVLNLIRQADPDNQTGLSTTLRLYDVGVELGETKDWEADLTRMKKLLNKPGLTAEQEQQLCCLCIGLMRRGGLKYKEEMKQMLDRLQKIDPDSLLGRSAVDARRLWVSELNLIQGWSPGVLPNDATPVEVEGKLPIAAAGTYEVTFTYTKGTEALRIAAVELYDGKKKVAEDRHPGSTGHKHSNNSYSLTVPAAVKNPHLFVTFNMGAKRDSYGKITITKK